MAEQGHKWSETENSFDLIKIVDSKIIQYNDCSWLKSKVCTHLSVLALKTKA